MMNMIWMLETQRKTKKFIDNSHNGICELPSQIIHMTSFLISFVASEYKVTNRIVLISGMNYPLADTLAFSRQVLSLVPHSGSWATDARDIGLSNSSYVIRWLDTGQEFILALGCSPLMHIPLSSPSHVHTLFETIRKIWNYSFAKLYDWELLGEAKFDVESFDAVYLDGILKRTIDKNYVSLTGATTNYLVPFPSQEYVVPEYIARPVEITHPFTNVIHIHIHNGPCLSKTFKVFHGANSKFMWLRQELVVNICSSFDNGQLMLYIVYMGIKDSDFALPMLLRC